MKNNWPIKKLGEIIVGIAILAFAIAFFIVGRYWFSGLALVLLVILPRLERLERIVLSRSGLEAEFKISEENIRKDIEENHEPVTEETFTHFRQVEERVLKDIHKKLGGELKNGIHFMYGMPDRPEFVYTPDATIQTEKEIIFLEIKYVLKPEFAKRIVENALKYLSEILRKLGPSAGNKLVAKLILVSSYDLDRNSFDVPEDIEIELYKI